MNELTILRLANNKIYVGKVDDGKCTGKSIIVHKNGNLYEGEMLHNKRHGKGTYVHVNHGWYKGGFENDQKTGYGIEVLYHKNGIKSRNNIHKK